MLQHRLGRGASRALSASTAAGARDLARCASPAPLLRRSFASKPPSNNPPPPSSSSSSTPQNRRPAAGPPGVDADGRSFRGQMLESISSRMAREKAEREKIAQQRQDTASSRNAATTFMLLFVGAACYYLGTKTPQEPSPDSTLPLSATRAPRHRTSRAELEAAWADFVAIVGADNVSTAEADIATHSASDWSSHSAPEGTPHPFCVVYPSSTEEVSRVVKICHARRIPVIGFGGGTSLEGNFAPTRGGIVIDFSRHMDRIITVHKEDLDAVVQPGLGWEALNEVLAEQGLLFPPDPGPGAQIGGMIGTGCSGTNAYRYGTMRDWVLSLTVVLADGTVIKTRQRPRKSSAGYDLTRLLIGSEGTLGLVTEATLKLAVRPTETSVAVAAFPDLRAAAACAARVVGEGVPVAAIEVLDDAQMKCINTAGSTLRRWAEAPTLMFKFAGSTARAVREQIDAVQAAAKAANAVSFDFAKSADEQAELWSARKEALWSAIATKQPGERVWTGDVAVPISRLPDAIEEAQADLRRVGLRGTIVGHVGDGNFHTIVLYAPEQRATAEEFVHRMVKRAIELEGTVTGEHGVGLVKRDYLPHEVGEETVAVMRKMKAALDPLCLLNCDKVVRMQKPKDGEIAEW
ncbi:D-lactate dehydrogenase (cytochrome) [Sporothrix schenckii 1099-18]|uniref:D-lactate dehydrogenase (cytochrome) n=1 Tax=Sporothrix schenckii 1099-18 TaxID=1397361 RepID=A0A0F2LYH9_SPOSC|nr:D-lactate dehydrogenase (cytochrome) [Sporothrix schenckii 1099-18]KJR81545.1 D-lactate dehydrogenase (cytochrome) [Sporothrix schenckii 1099-18]